MEISIKKVVTTLLEAIALVFCVMYLFMQNFRATLIPTLVVPVALLGTLGVMLGLGYSINVLTMFGMVLAIGILVDDAIVVVENVERIMAEEGLSPHDATVKAMGQISGAIIGITVVLVSVFVPMAFFDGAVGNIYRQFSVTLAVSIAFSAFLALSLTPALCATMLRPIPAGHHEKRGFFGWFNRAFVRLTAGYTARVAGVLSRPVRFGLAYAAVIAAVALLFVRLPSSFLPEEDQGSFNAMVILPQGATQAETRKLVLEVENYMMKHEPVRFVYSVSGFSEYGSGPNSAMFFVTLKDWKERHGADMHVDAVVARVNKAFADHKNAMVLALNAPPAGAGLDLGLRLPAAGPRRPGLPGPDEGPPAAAGGRRRTSGAGRGHARRPGRSPAAATAHRPRQGPGHARVDGGNQHRAGGDVRLGLHRRLHAQRPGAPRDGAGRRQEPRRRGGRVAPARAQCAGPDGAHVGLRHAGLDHGTAAAEPLQRLPAFKINGSAAPGHSSGEAMRAMEQLASELPRGIGFAWSGQSYEEKLSGNQANVLFALSILVVFLALAALYESWAIPLAVILVVPLGVIGALLGVTLRGMPNDIYFKVGLIATIGLSAKNAILIVEVARTWCATARA